VPRLPQVPDAAGAADPDQGEHVRARVYRTLEGQFLIFAENYLGPLPDGLRFVGWTEVPLFDEGGEEIHRAEAERRGRKGA
jgi:hypothetical protein